MTQDQNIKLLSMKLKLSSLWIVVLFNMLFRDIHEFARTGYLDELLAMTSNGAQISEGLLLAAAIVLEIPIIMIFLIQILNVKVNRWVNPVAAIAMIVAIVGNNLAPDLDDLFYVVFECVALILVIWYALRWSKD